MLFQITSKTLLKFVKFDMNFHNLSSQYPIEEDFQEQIVSRETGRRIPEPKGSEAKAEMRISSCKGCCCEEGQEQQEMCLELEEDIDLESSI